MSFESFLGGCKFCFHTLHIQISNQICSNWLGQAWIPIYSERFFICPYSYRLESSDLSNFTEGGANSASVPCIVKFDNLGYFGYLPILTILAISTISVNFRKFGNFSNLSILDNLRSKDPPSVCFDLLTLALRSTTNSTKDFVTAPGCFRESSAKIWGNFEGRWIFQVTLIKNGL